MANLLLLVLTGAFPVGMLVAGVKLWRGRKAGVCVSVVTMLVGTAGLVAAVWYAVPHDFSSDPLAAAALLMLPLIVGGGTLAVWVMCAMPALLADVATWRFQKKRFEPTPAHQASSAPPPHG